MGKSSIRNAQRSSTWKLEDAKARFSEVVRRAREVGPQHVTRRGENAVVILSEETYQALRHGGRTGEDLVAFLQSSGLDGISLERPVDRGRDVEW